MKTFLIMCLFILFAVISYFFYQQAYTQATYEGLPTVPCIDTTQSLRQNFTFALHITIAGKAYKLDPTIGHDAGNCLHDIFTNDATGKVYVQSNDNEAFTLGQFFDVWHKTFSNEQLSTYFALHPRDITVFVNNQQVTTYRTTPLLPNEIITIICK